MAIQTPSAGLNAGFQDKQNGWGAAVNENWQRLDLLSVPFVLSANVALPPDNPQTGDRYLVPANALSLWSDKGGQIAVWNETQWLYYAPKNGWKFTSLAEKKTFIFDGTIWAIWVESLPPDVLAKIDAAIASSTTAQAAAAQTTSDKAAVTVLKQQTETARDIAATSATNAQQARSGAIAARDAAQQASIDAAAARDGARQSEQTAMYAAQQLSSAVSDTTANAQAAQAAAINAQNSATSALASWQSLDGRYLGGKATAPTTNNQGGPLAAGMLYLNSTDNLLYVYANGTWNKTTPNSAIQVSTVVASANQTVFNTPAQFTPGSNTVDVWVNGARLNIGTDYTEATNGNSITLVVPASVSGEQDEVTIRVIQTLAFGSTASNLVTHGSSTVKDALDAINLTDYSALRAYTGLSNCVNITGYFVSAKPSGIAGPFTYDPTDTTSLDNGGTIIVSANGKRWKRQYSGYISVAWFEAKGIDTDDTAAFQAAARAANKGASVGSVPGGTVFVPNPVTAYRVSKIGIRGTRFIGENRDATIIKGIGTGSASEFMFDAQLDLDGTTPNTTGGGWCENMTIDANGSGRSLLRTYGGGVQPNTLMLKNAVATGAVGLAMGLPIWATAKNCYAVNCYTGFKTLSGPNDNGTSLTFIDCWANACTNYGFDITQLYYSSFINCVAQDCGVRNWNVNGLSNGLSSIYSLQFIGCATEGSGVPFYFKNVRDITLISPRIINPTPGVDLVTFDNCSGTISDYSTPSAPSGGAYHLKVLNHATGTGTIKIVGGQVTYNPADLVANDAIALMAAKHGRLLNSQSVNYTLTLDDAGKTILHAAGAGAGHTFTIPANAAVAYPVGTEIVFANRDGNSVSIAINSDTLILASTFTTGTRTLAAQAMAIARKVASTIWLIGSEGGGLS